MKTLLVVAVLGLAGCGFKTVWIGKVVVAVPNGVDPYWGPSIGYINDLELGLRSDGVCVLRKRP